MTEQPDHETATVDLARMVDLPGTQWCAAVCITPEGTESLWLVAPTDDNPAGCDCATCAPHEQTGPWVAPPTTVR
jgi:hypothetical protein